MDTKRNSNEKTVDITIRPTGGDRWSQVKMEKVTAMAKAKNNQRNLERIRKNAMSVVRYRMEEYVRSEDSALEKVYTIEDFVKDFLKVLGLKKGEFARYIDIDDSNLNKYYKSDRRFNTILALKFAHFFHTSADLWLKVQVKNELFELQREKEVEEKYKKYDYEKVLLLA
jgi:plasmid maintenance system antidote protein VapI